MGFSVSLSARRGKQGLSAVTSFTRVDIFLLEHLVCCFGVDGIVLVLLLDSKISALMILLLYLRRKPVRRCNFVLVEVYAFMLLSWLLILEVDSGVPSEAASDFALVMVHTVVVVMHVF